MMKQAPWLADRTKKASDWLLRTGALVYLERGILKRKEPEGGGSNRTTPGDLFKKMYIRLKENLEWQSSEVDWCEENYAHSHLIVEYYNTVSNVPFVLLPLVVVLLSRGYSARISYDLNVILVLLSVVGTSSAYFHATLSHFGQILDEMSIVWVSIAANAFWLPLDYFPGSFGKTRWAAQKLLMLTCLVCTILGCIFPAVNMFALMVTSVFVCRVVYTQCKEQTDVAVKRLAGRGVTCWFVGMALWCLDKFGCNTYTSQHYPYLHAIWHIAAILASVSVAVSAGIVECRKSRANVRTQLAFFPSWTGELGIPYILVTSDSNMNYKQT